MPLQVYGRSNGANFRVASNPEFLREGTAVGDFFHPDRIVVGVEDAESERQLREIYRPFLEGSVPLPRSPAEMSAGACSGVSGDHHCQRRTDQARFELLPGLEDFLRQPDCRSLREAGRKRRRGHSRHGARSAHRTAFPQRRSRLWRVLSAQRHTGVHSLGRKAWRRFQLAARSRGGQQAPHRAVRGEGPPRLVGRQG